MNTVLVFNSSIFGGLKLSHLLFRDQHNEVKMGKDRVRLPAKVTYCVAVLNSGDPMAALIVAGAPYFSVR